MTQGLSARQADIINRTEWRDHQLGLRLCIGGHRVVYRRQSVGRVGSTILAVEAATTIEHKRWAVGAKVALDRA